MTELAGKKLLIVDDEPDLREVLALQFEQVEFDVVEASNGVEALEVLEKGGIEGILSDIRMPKMDGVKLLESVREKYGNQLGLVFVTGFADISEPEAYAKGADGFVKKPYDREVLTDMVSAIFLTNKERWNRSLPDGAAIDINASASELSIRGECDQLRLGRHGFFYRMQGAKVPQIGTLVNFSIQFAGGPIPVLNGKGVVRWGRNENQEELGTGIGVEIFQLEEASLAPFSALMEKVNPLAFIPDRLSKR